MNADKKSKKKAKNLDKNALNLSTNSKDKSKKNAQKSVKNLTQNSNENSLNLKSNSSKKSLNSRLNSNENLGLNSKSNLGLNSAQISKQNPPTNKKTFWPYGILLSLFAIVGACVATIIYASNYPVYEDDSFLGKYQEVDYNFNEIKLKDENFKNSYQVSLNLKPQIDKKKREFYEVKPAQVLVFRVAERNDLSKKASDINATLLLTRPHTNKQDEWLQTSEFKLANKPFKDKFGKLSTGYKKHSNTYAFTANLPNLAQGRWQLKLKLTKDENSIGFYEFNLLVSEP